MNRGGCINVMLEKISSHYCHEYVSVFSPPKAVGETYHGRLGSISSAVGHVGDEQSRVIIGLDPGGG